jgi:hypothetical protein
MRKIAKAAVPRTGRDSFSHSFCVAIQHLILGNI